MRIGTASKLLRLNPRTLRFYETIGLLPPPERTESGYRVYSERDLRRVEFVRKAQQLGLTLREVREIIAFRDRSQVPCPYVKDLIERKRQEIDGRIRELSELKAALDGLAEQAAIMLPGRLEEQTGICHLIECHSIRTIEKATESSP